MSGEDGVEEVCQRYNAERFRQQIAAMAGIRVDVPLEDGNFSNSILGDGKIACFEGHSPVDSVLRFLDGHGLAFTGDLCVVDGERVLLGRTDLLGGDRSKLATAIRQTLAILPNNCLVCPGEGEPFRLTSKVRERVLEEVEVQLENE